MVWFQIIELLNQTQQPFQQLSVKHMKSDQPPTDKLSVLRHFFHLKDRMQSWDNPIIPKTLPLNENHLKHLLVSDELKDIPEMFKNRIFGLLANIHHLGQLKPWKPTPVITGFRHHRHMTQPEIHLHWARCELGFLTTQRHRLWWRRKCWKSLQENRPTTNDMILS